jgi:hypothetical protein
MFPWESAPMTVDIFYCPATAGIAAGFLAASDNQPHRGRCHPVPEKRCDR